MTRRWTNTTAIRRKVLQDDTDAAQLQKLIDTKEMNSTRSTEANDKILSLTCAAVAVEVDEIMLGYVYSFP